MAVSMVRSTLLGLSRSGMAGLSPMMRGGRPDATPVGTISRWIE